MVRDDAVREFLQAVSECETLLIGIGEEWKAEKLGDVQGAYGKLASLVEGKNYFIVTANTDGEILKSTLDASRIVAPCGNVEWRQCSRACTKDIWELGEVADDHCPHCGAPLTGNTIEAETYIEEGYLGQWRAYTQWLTGTLRTRLLVLELGVGFQVPTVIRWPFEKTVFYNQKSRMYRIHHEFYQASEEIRERMVPVAENSVEFISAV